MFALGCIQALKCHKNTCPTGITTHDPRFQAGLVVEDKDKRVANYVKAIVKDVETIAHSVGVSEPRKLPAAMCGSCRTTGGRSRWTAADTDASPGRAGVTPRTGHNRCVRLGVRGWRGAEKPSHSGLRVS
jgi:hypothetical protein